MSCRDTHCPKCASEDIAYDVIHAFYRCDGCHHVWIRPEDDFDFNEADFLLEQVNQLQPEYPPDYVMRGVYFSDEHPQGYPYDPSESEEECDTIWVVQAGSDASGRAMMRFESTLPGDVVLPSFTSNSLFTMMEKGYRREELN